jgi:hypothetical protein
LARLVVPSPSAECPDVHNRIESFALFSALAQQPAEAGDRRRDTAEA